MVCSRKARRKERDGEGAGDPKLYLQEALLERKLPDLDMRRLVDLPDGLDYNEWLASHSQYHTTQHNTTTRHTFDQCVRNAPGSRTKSIPGLGIV